MRPMNKMWISPIISRRWAMGVPWLSTKAKAVFMKTNWRVRGPLPNGYLVK